MPRLFVALRPPKEVRESLTALMGGVEEARWQNDNQLHLTLAFIGEVDGNKVEDAIEALERVSAPSLTLSVSGIGSFDGARPGFIGTLWAGVEPSAPLTSLSNSIRQALRMAGIATENRRFVPHITLARFSGGGVPQAMLHDWLSSSNPPAQSFIVESFHLVESRLGATGAYYDPIASYPLKGSSVGQYPRQP